MDYAHAQGKHYHFCSQCKERWLCQHKVDDPKCPGYPMRSAQGSAHWREQPHPFHKRLG